MQKSIIQFNLMRTISYYSRILIIYISGLIKDWQLCFNVTKCKVLHIGSNQHYRVYRLGSDCITSSSVEKDLGILVDNKLRFHEQCSAVAAKANRLLGVIRRLFDAPMLK